MKLTFAKNLIGKFDNLKIDKELWKVFGEEIEYNEKLASGRFKKLAKADALYNFGIFYNNLADILDEQGHKFYAIQGFNNAIQTTIQARTLYAEFFKGKSAHKDAMNARDKTNAQIAEYQVNLNYVTELYNEQIAGDDTIQDTTDCYLPAEKKQRTGASSSSSASSSCTSMDDARWTGVERQDSGHSDASFTSEELNLAGVLALSGVYVATRTSQAEALAVQGFFENYAAPGAASTQALSSEADLSQKLS